jgi:hypothetical protein
VGDGVGAGTGGKNRRRHRGGVTDFDVGDWVGGRATM